MGAGKTILIGSFFATEFAMAQEYPANGFFELSAFVGGNHVCPVHKPYPIQGSGTCPCLFHTLGTGESMLDSIVQFPKERSMYKPDIDQRTSDLRRTYPTLSSSTDVSKRCNS